MNITAHTAIAASTKRLSTPERTRCAFFIFAKEQTNVWRKKIIASPVTSITAARESVSSAQKKKITAGMRK